MRNSLLFLAAELIMTLTLVVGGPQPRPTVDRSALEQPVPTKTRPRYHTTDKTKFWLDGVGVTEKEFNSHDGLVIEEIVIVGDEVLVIKAHTKK